MHAFDRQTDGRTDRILIARPRLHCMQHGKNWLYQLLWNYFKLSTNRSHYDLRKFSFTNRTVNIRDSLTNAVVDVDSVDLFKSRLDNFWMFPDVKYDYTANPAGTGDRSEYDTESYWKAVVLYQEWYRHRGSSEPASYKRQRRHIILAISDYCTILSASV